MGALWEHFGLKNIDNSLIIKASASFALFFL